MLGYLIIFACHGRTLNSLPSVMRFIGRNLAVGSLSNPEEVSSAFRRQVVAAVDLPPYELVTGLVFLETLRRKCCRRVLGPIRGSMTDSLYRDLPAKSSQFGTLRPTIPNKIENLRVEVPSPTWGERPRDGAAGRISSEVKTKTLPSLLTVRIPTAMGTTIGV